MRSSDWSSDVCSSDLGCGPGHSLLAQPVQDRPLAVVMVEGWHDDVIRSLRVRAIERAKRRLRPDRQGRHHRNRRPIWRNHNDIGNAGSGQHRSEEHTSELQSLMRTSYAVFCLKKKKTTDHTNTKPAYEQNTTTITTNNNTTQSLQQ